MTPQDQLDLLYKDHWASIEALMKETLGLSGPTLISIPEKYLASKTKLMIIGQQTFGWRTGCIDDLLKWYREFNFGEHYNSSPFWNVIKKTTDILGISRFSIAWTNLVKCDLNEGRPPLHIEELVQRAFPVLEKEISILQPQIIIFFTGPQYDQRIQESFQEVTFQPVEKYDVSLLSKLVSPILPVNSFRTYHPKYLRMSGNENAFLTHIRSLIC